MTIDHLEIIKVENLGRNSYVFRNTDQLKPEQGYFLVREMGGNDWLVIQPISDKEYYDLMRAVDKMDEAVDTVAGTIE